MGILLILAIWWGLGFIGYMMMRQGFLVHFEPLLGKKRAWGITEIAAGILGMAAGGPLFILGALMVKGKYCFGKRKRNTRKKNEECREKES